MKQILQHLITITWAAKLIQIVQHWDGKYSKSLIQLRSIKSTSFKICLIIIQTPILVDIMAIIELYLILPILKPARFRYSTTRPLNQNEILNEFINKINF